MNQSAVRRRAGSRFGNVALHVSKLAATLALLALTVPAATAPAGKGARFTWPKDARVSVRLNGDLAASDACRLAVESAFSKWERAGRADANGSGVRYEIGGEATFIHHVTYGRVRTGGQAHTMMLSAPGGIFVAWTVVDRRVTDPVALSHVMAHEIGHTFGLAECDSCEPGSSVMTRFNGDYNDVVTGRNAPSEADNAAVRTNGGY